MVLAAAEAEVQASNEAVLQAQAELEDADRHTEQVFKSIAGEEGAKGVAAPPAQLVEYLSVLDPNDPTDKACMDHWAAKVAKAVQAGKNAMVADPKLDVAMHVGGAAEGGGSGAGGEPKGSAPAAGAAPTGAGTAEAPGDRDGPPPRAARAYSRSRSPEGRVQKLAAKLHSWSGKAGAQLSPDQLQAAQRELWEAATKLASSEDEGL